MNRTLLKILRAPGTGAPLKLVERAADASGVREGWLIDESTRRGWPILDGVPMMLESVAPASFLERHREALSGVDLRPAAAGRWSFSAEWESHFRQDLDRTWGWTVGQRVEQFFLETLTEPNGLKDRWILDAGCGNGQLSEGLAHLGANVVGLDYSTSVVNAEQRRRVSNVSFVRGDLQEPPFEAGAFDLVVSNGVLHHTPDTYHTFRKVAALVRPGGKFYLWLYRRPEGFLRRYLLYGGLDAIRAAVSRLPGRLQASAVRGYARGLRIRNRLRGVHGDVSFAEQVVSAYDTLTPRWRHYHTPMEVGAWFFRNGFSPATLTHWDNPYGFGLVAEKRAQPKTPGIHFT